MPHTDPFVDVFLAWIEVSRSHSIRDFLRYSRESGLSMSQLGALYHIHRIGSSGVTDVGDHLGVTSAAASQMLERLVQQGLILRSVDPSDRRVKHVVLTAEGRQVLQESMRARQRWLYNLAEALSDPEKETLIAAFNLLIDKAHQLEQSIEPDRSTTLEGVCPTCDD